MLIDMLTGLTVSGSVAAAACLLVRKAARGRLSARWEYRMVKLSLVFALAPLGQLFSRAEALLDSLGAEAPVLPAAVQLPLQSGTAGTVPLVPPAITAAPASPAPLVLPHWVLALAAGVWGLGALWMLARKLRARRALGRLVRSARPVTEETVLETLRRCREQLGLHQPVTLRASAAVFSPLVTGLVRPVILLPEFPAGEETPELVLRHELAHLKRQDLRYQRLLCASRSPFAPRGAFHKSMSQIERKIHCFRHGSSCRIYIVKLLTICRFSCIMYTVRFVKK